VLALLKTPFDSPPRPQPLKMKLFNREGERRTQSPPAHHPKPKQSSDSQAPVRAEAAEQWQRERERERGARKGADLSMKKNRRLKKKQQQRRPKTHPEIARHGGNR